MLHARDSGSCPPCSLEQLEILDCQVDASVKQPLRALSMARQWKLVRILAPTLSSLVCLGSTASLVSPVLEEAAGVEIP